MLDWDDLRYFVALADEGSLSAVARRLKVDHATVARRIAALEERMGARLVDRRPRRYLLTDKGRQVADHARRMEAEVFALERESLPSDMAEPVEISVTAPPVIAAMLIAPRTPALRSSHPRIRLRLVSDSRTLSLSRREADVALRLNRPTDANLVIRKVASIRYGLYAAPDYLAGRAPAEHGFILFDDTLADTPQQTWLRQLIEGRDVVLRTNDLSVQCAAAAAGLGIAVLPGFVAGPYGLAELPATAPPIWRDAYLTYHEDLRDNAAVTAVAAFVADCMRAAR